ncbi:unnamed protein product, partial [Mesorhabditis spiculigera]
MRRADSCLFAPYRSVGLVCNDVRPAYRQQPGFRRFTSLVCAVDNVVLHYRAEKLRLAATSDSFPEKVTHVMCDKNCIYGVAGSRIGVLPLCRDITRWIDTVKSTKHCIIFGSQFVVVDVDNGLRVIDVEDGTIALHIEGSPHFDISALVHPPTYVNKVLFGSSQGKLRLYNTRTGKMIHEFASKFDAPIVRLEPTPAVDVIAIGLQNGRIILHNVKTDETVCSFRHDNAITAIGFRNDEAPLMTTADETGMIAVWDLEKRELLGRISGIHTAAVTSLYFMPGEPVMISTSEDNSMRAWILDQADGMPRQLVIHEGHSEAIQTILFTGQHEVMSAGLDGSLRKYSVENQAMRHKLGSAGTMAKAKAKKMHIDLDSIKLEPIVEIAMGTTRSAQWDNVLCRHRDTLVVTTWTTSKSTQGTHRLAHKRFTKTDTWQGTTATSIAISPCGNFAFIGYSSGHIDQYNVQSARLKRTFVAELTEESKENGVAHDTAVCGLTVDALGHELISGGRDGRLRFWDLRTGKMKATLKATGSIVKMVSCKANSLLAVALENLDGSSFVSVFDILTRKAVRVFKTIGNGLLALEFSSNGRWLLTSDAEGYIRIWELSTSSLIDVMLAGSPCIGLSFNETGHYLATCHAAERAIYVWANKTLFIGTIPLRSLPLDYKPSWEQTRYIPDVEDAPMEELTAKLEQLDASLVTYSGLAPSRWANLPNIAIIKERNRPVEPPKKPKQAPFFLSTAPTLDGFEFEKMDTENIENEERKILEAKRSMLEMESTFSTKLRRAKSEADFIACFADLKQMSVSATDFQIRTLSEDVLGKFVRMLLAVEKTRQNFDLTQAYTAAFTKIHGNSLWKSDADDELTEALAELGDLQEEIWTEYDTLTLHNVAVVQWAKNALL